MRRIFSTVFGAQSLLIPIGQGRLLGEGAGVDETLDPLAHRQLALLLRLFVMPLRPAAKSGLERLCKVSHAREPIRLPQDRTASNFWPGGPEI
jgi:hypothetical protein